MNTFKQLVKRLFQYEASLVLKKYKPTIIIISGSVGKTSTRDAIYHILSKKFFVRKTEKSFTTELGIPLTIIGCSYGSGKMVQWLSNIATGLQLIVFKKRYPTYLILEVDCDKPKDLITLSRWLSPDILVLTAIGETPTHVELFDSVEKLLEEQSVLATSVTREGCVVYNADDESTARVAEKSLVERISCGLTPDCIVYGDMFKIAYNKEGKNKIPVGMTFSVLSPVEKIISLSDSIGIQNEYACLLALGVAKKIGLSLADSVSALQNHKAEKGRMNILAGIKDTIIIDDSYNSSPLAIKESLRVLDDIKCSGRKIAVIGDMFELGKFSSVQHKKIGQQLPESISHIVCVGIRARFITEELLTRNFEESRISEADTAIEAGKIVQNLINTGDVVLVKGSQAMRMERVVEEIMRYPEDKAKLLVRQEPEWLERD